MNLGLGQSQQLQQKLSFQMIQSLKLLQVTTLQLEQMLKTELELNPILEIEEDLEIEDERRERDEDDGEPNDDDQYLEELKSGEDGIDWDEYLDEGFDLGYSYNEEADPNEERYEQSPVYDETLEEHLNNQLSEKKFEERIKLLVQFLIGSLDDDGYLRLTVAEISEATDAAGCEVEDAIGVLHRLDPAGVGARDLRECMMLQLRARKMEDTLAMAVLTDHWDSLEKHKIPEIARHLGVEPREVQEAAEVLKTLNPKPGSQYGGGNSSTIIPDLIVEKVEGKFVVMLNDRTIPSLTINKLYADMAKRGSKARAEEREYIREKLNSANWFIKSIEQRRSTMLKVMYAIIARQKIFFEKGPPNIVPLKQQEIADDIDMHISTISRVANSKYVQTQHGIFELKYFFTEAAGQLRGRQKGRAKDSGDAEGADSINADSGSDGDIAGGADVSVERIKVRIKTLIEDEDPKAPLTDQAIADILKAENLPAARRTVAKYREQMKILTTRMRLKYD
ncbi:MAG: RNA polymerase factor sigma-54 [Chitinispirillia bacterium]|nr:RNA polymerase factor sigma-54 [Chitinispirillia bacterium]MCL2268530.1 RNA polymerase factor sigma-54 [Chitinispirillia bacterium]